MFGLGGAELFVVLILAIIFIGPKELPGIAAQLGKLYRQLKGATEDLKDTVEREINLSENPPPSTAKEPHGRKEHDIPPTP